MCNEVIDPLFVFIERVTNFIGAMKKEITLLYSLFFHMSEIRLQFQLEGSLIICGITGLNVPSPQE